MRGGRYLEKYTALSNALLALPQDITVRAAQCGDAGRRKVCDSHGSHGAPEGEMTQTPVRGLTG